QLVHFCGLQSTLLGLIAEGLKQMGAPVPPGIGSVALSMATAQQKLNELLGANYDRLSPEAQQAIREILEEDQWPKSR
ncbi:unnamed protein product, partial [marine sediment metagenome]